jgi:hypothetical protein
VTDFGVNEMTFNEMCFISILVVNAFLVAFIGFHYICLFVHWLANRIAERIFEP